MRRIRLFPAGAAPVVLALAASSVTQAAPADFPQNIRVKNFGSVNEKLYRGAQPEGRDYGDLAALGIKSVIDLEQGGQSDEQQKVESSGMKFYRIGMSDSSSPDQSKVEEFLQLVNDPADQPVFVHCHGGRHRTGAMIAVYRMTHDGWTADRAYQEMKDYQFESGFGHGALKDYVFDYYAHPDQKVNAAASQANKEPLAKPINASVTAAQSQPPTSESPSPQEFKTGSNSVTDLQIRPKPADLTIPQKAAAPADSVIQGGKSALAFSARSETSRRRRVPTRRGLRGQGYRRVSQVLIVSSGRALT